MKVLAEAKDKESLDESWRESADFAKAVAEYLLSNNQEEFLRAWRKIKNAQFEIEAPEDEGEYNKLLTKIYTDIAKVIKKYQ